MVIFYSNRLNFCTLLDNTLNPNIMLLWIREKNLWKVCCRQLSQASLILLSTLGVGHCIVTWTQTHLCLSQNSWYILGDHQDTNIYRPFRKHLPELGNCQKVTPHPFFSQQLLGHLWGKLIGLVKPLQYYHKTEVRVVRRTLKLL